MPVKNHADYLIVSDTEAMVFIKDLDLGHKSVTNDAEWVVEEVLRKCGNKRIIYRDTEGNWDELLHDGVQFTDFAAYKGQLPI